MQIFFGKKHLDCVCFGVFWCGILGWYISLQIIGWQSIPASLELANYWLANCMSLQIVGWQTV
jgi:hypothetical protein